MTIGNERLTDAEAEAAAAALASHLRRLESAFEGSRETLEFLWDSYRDQWFVGGVIDLVGGPSLPTAEIWEYPLTALAVARTSITLAESKGRWARRFQESGRTDLAEEAASLEREAGDALADAARDVDEAGQALRAAQDRIEAFIEGTVAAGDRVVTGLRVAVVAGSVASMALGGAAVRAGAGLFASAAGSAVAGGTYGAGVDLLGQASEVHYGQRGEIDVGRALRRGAIDAVSGFVGSLTGGALTRALERALGGYLSSQVADDVLLQLGRQLGLGGPLPRTYLQTGGQRLAAEVLGEMGATPISSTVSALVERALDGEGLPGSAEEFVDMILGDMAEAGALQLALGAVVRRRASGGAPSVDAHGAGGDGAHDASAPTGGRAEGRTGPGSPPRPAPQQSGAAARALALEARLDSIAGHPDADRMRDMLEDAQRLAGEGHMDEADALLTRLERDVALGEDVSAKGGLERGMGSDEPEWLSRVAEYAPGERAPVRLDATAPLADDATGQMLLEHLQQAVARFEVEGLSERQLDALERLEAGGERSTLYSAFRGSRIDEFAKESAMRDPRLAHVHVTVPMERGADFLDSRTGRWYDITTTGAWQDHLDRYGVDPGGRRLPTETPDR